MPSTGHHLFDAFSQAARLFPQQPAITFYRQTTVHSLTFSQILSQVARYSEILKRAGIFPGDKVAIILENQPEYAITFFAIMACNATAVFLDNQFTPEQTGSILLHSGAKAVCTLEKFYRRWAALAPGVKVLLVDGPEFVPQPEGPSAPAREIIKEGPVPETAVLFYTSGTTQKPKAVMLTHGNLLANVSSIKAVNIVTDRDRVISILPLHHAYAFTVTLLTPLLVGANIVYPASLSSLDLLACMRDQRITIFLGVPQIFALMHKSIREKMKSLPFWKNAMLGGLGRIFCSLRRCCGLNLSRYLFAPVHKAYGTGLRFMASGGAKLDEEVAESFFCWGFTMIEGYGLTETAPVVAFNPLNKPKIGSVGQALPDVEIKILNPDADGIGEVAIKGPNVMTGYYQMEEETREVLKDGWFLSGDLGYLDHEKYLYLTGRKKEILVLSSGKKITPDEVERHYGKNRFIKEIAVLTAKEPGYLKSAEQLVAIIVLDEERFKAEQETNIREKLTWELDNLSAQLPTYKRIKGYVISKDNLPRTRLGKIMRYQLQELFVSLQEAALSVKPRLEAKEGAQNYSAMEQSAFAYIEKAFGRKVGVQEHLELDLGLDSLGRIEFLFGLQECLGLEMSDDQAMDFFRCSTIEELLAKLRELFPESRPEVAVKQEHARSWSEILGESPAMETLTKIKLRFGILSVMFNLLFILFFKILFRVLFLLRVEGRQHLPENGPYLICPNHTSYLDGLFIFCALPTKVLLNTYFVGFSQFFENFILRPFIRVARLIPIEISFNLVEALRACAYVLRNKKIVCYFPEGQRSIDGDVKEFKKGVGILLKETEVPVVPVYLDGAFKTWPRGRNLPRLARVTVRFGEAVSVNELYGQSVLDRDVYETVAANLRAKVALLKEERR